MFWDERVHRWPFNHQKVLKQQAHYHHVGCKSCSFFAFLQQFLVLNTGNWKAIPDNPVGKQ